MDPAETLLRNAAHIPSYIFSINTDLKPYTYIDPEKDYQKKKNQCLRKYKRSVTDSAQDERGYDHYLGTGKRNISGKRQYRCKA